MSSSAKTGQKSSLPPQQCHLSLWNTFWLCGMQINYMGLRRGRRHSISYSVNELGWILAGFGLCPVCTLCPLVAAAHSADCQTYSRVQARSLPVAGHQRYPARVHRHAAVPALLLLPGAVRNWGAAGWEIPRAVTSAHVCLLLTAPLSPQEPPMEAAPDAYCILKRKKGFQHLKSCS